jgi:hypothetical protein
LACLSGAPSAAQVTKTDILANFFLPGYAQLRLGNPEGWYLLTGTAYISAGMALVPQGENDSSLTTSLYTQDLGKLAGLTLYQLGSTQFSYSTYDLFQKVELGSANSLSLTGALAAPFEPAVACDTRVAPIVLLRFVTSLSEQLSAWSYARETGTALPPLPVQSLAAVSLTAATGFMAGYIEELAFHGMMQPALQKKRLF